MEAKLEDILEEYRGRRWYLDTESDGLAHEATRFWCAVFADLDDSNTVLSFGPETVGESLRILLGHAKLVIGHNIIGHDLPLARRLHGVEIGRERVRDSLVLSRTANPGRIGGHSIEAWGERIGIRKPVHEDWSKFSFEMMERCETDVRIGVFVTRYLYAKELADFSDESILVDHEMAWLAEDMKQQGFYLYRDRAHDLFTKTKGLADELQARIRNVFPDRPKDLGLKRVRVKKDGTFFASDLRYDGIGEIAGPYHRVSFEPFNIDSPPQRIERLLSVGWKPTKFTKPSKTHPKGQPKFEAEDLENDPNISSYPEEVRFIGTYLLLRSRERTANSWLEEADEKGYVHGMHTVNGTWTTRFSHSKPNLGNPPAVMTEKDENGNERILWGLPGLFKAECRACWGVDPKDYLHDTLVGADLSGIQLRAFAHYTEDKDYIALVSDPLGDIHSVHRDYLGLSGPQGRKTAKTYIYAFLLGAGHAKLGQILGGGLKEGKDSYALFSEKVPGVKLLKETKVPEWYRKGYVPRLDGGCIPFLEERLGLAAALQGFEATVMKHTLTRLDKWSKASHIPWKLRAVPHDEAQMTTQKRYAELVGETFKATVAQVGNELGSLCPLTGEFKIGTDWSQTH